MAGPRTARRPAIAVATMAVSTSPAAVAPSEAIPPAYSTSSPIMPPERSIASSARPPGQARAAPAAAATAVTRRASERISRLACRGVPPMVRSRPISAARCRTVMPMVEATENSTISAPQPPTTAPMIVSDSASASDTGPEAVSIRVAKEPISAVPSSTVTKVAANAVERCRSDRSARPVIGPRPGRRGAPSDPRRRRRWAAPSGPRPARRRGTRPCRRTPPRPGRG